jgi:hypothetical protein
MKTVVATIFLSLLSCCALAQDKRAISAAEAGCGPQDAKFEVKSDVSQHPTPMPEDGKALIYVVADRHLTTLFGFDEKWVGAVSSGINGTTYFSCQSTPVNIMSARCCNPFFNTEALRFMCIY